MEVILGRSVRFASIFGSSPAFKSINFQELVRCVHCTDSRHWRMNVSERYPRYRTLSCNYVPLLNHITTYKQPFIGNINRNDITLAYYCDSKQTPKDCQQVEPEKVSVFQKMKQLTKDYWHILIPVHLVTSLGWVAIFYVAAKNGVDIVKIMEFMNLSEKYLEMLRNSSAGNWAVTYALYKIFTPLRYTVTVGGTTLAIRHLNKLGLMKASSFRKQPQGANKPVRDTLYHGVKQIYGRAQGRI